MKSNLGPIAPSAFSGTPLPFAEAGFPRSKYSQPDAVYVADNDESISPAMTSDGDTFTIGGTKKLANESLEQINDVVDVLSKIPVESHPDVPPDTAYLINTEAITPPLGTLGVEEKNYSHEQLLIALYWIYDVFERANMNFFVIDDTARAIRRQGNLYGSQVTIGTRLLEWVSGSKTLIDTYLQDESIDTTEEPDKVTYIAPNGVPIVLHIFNGDETITSLDQIPYEHEYFQIPNPFERFEELYRHD